MKKLCWWVKNKTSNPGIEGGKNTRFKRKHNLWTIDNQDDGWVDYQGRMRVYFPNHIKANKTGYVKRHLLHYEFFNNIKIPEGFDIHHKDGNKLNDSVDNLELIKHEIHSSLTNKKIDSKVKKICLNCNKEFYIYKCRIKDNITRGKYCSLICRIKNGM